MLMSRYPFCSHSYHFFAPPRLCFFPYIKVMGNFNRIYRTDIRAKMSMSSHVDKNDDIDVDRLVWDVEYREIVKRLLQPKGNTSVSLGA